MRQRLNFGPKRDKKAEDQRLALLAQELGAAMLIVLINDYGFTQAAANEALGKVLEQAKTNRLMITANTVLSAYDVLAKEDFKDPRSGQTARADYQDKGGS